MSFADGSLRNGSGIMTNKWMSQQVEQEERKSEYEREKNLLYISHGNTCILVL
jgi:hypothetical protein